MTTTAIPSLDVGDFKENIQDFDRMANGTGTYTDRFGKDRLTLDEFMRRNGYEVPVAFASGIAVSRTTQTVTYSGVTYHALATAIPFTTTGTFNAAQWEVISGVSRQELASSSGAGLVGQGVNTIADFLAQAVAASNLASGKVAKVVACVLRNEGAGWYAIDDAGHVPVGLSSLSIVGKSLNLTYGFSGTRVISLVAVPDERTASWGVTCGTSVGQNSAQVHFYGPLSGAVLNTGIQFNTVLGHDVTQTVDAANGTIAVTHDAISHTAGNGSAVALSGAPLYGDLKVSVTKVGFDLKYTKKMDFIFSWPASVLAVSSNCVGVTAVWDAAGYIQVTHPDTGGVQQVCAQENNSMGAIHARVSNITATGFRVYFYNTSGTLITTPSSSMVPYCTRDVNMPAPIPSGAVGFYNRDAVPMNAANFVTGASGNIWVIGLIEDDL